MVGRRSLITLRVETVSKEQQRSTGVKELHHRLPQFVVLYGLRDVVIEACLRSILDLVFHGICRQSHDWNLGIVVVLFPGANLAARVVTILHGHLNIALERIDQPFPLVARKDLSTYDDE